ncbi:hypothetical protein OEZ86_001641 [Tetradesmus obliquus]|nr:hypothetical protein OEZ86_001641 [Tetradesmus obliquus]
MTSSSNNDGSLTVWGATATPSAVNPGGSTSNVVYVQPGSSISSGVVVGTGVQSMSGTSVNPAANAPAAGGAAQISGAAAGAGTAAAAAAAAAAAPPQPVEYPGNIVNVPATAFDPGYCVPRQAFVTVNLTALACDPGSNLTKWDGQDVCARIDCEAKLTRSNLIYAPSFCRTVVEPPRLICPQGCDLVTQTLKNTSSNATRQVARCACRAGNQPCPGSYTGCVCQPAWIPNLNSSSSYVLCAAQQGDCDYNCQLTANSLGPLCPIIRDSTMPDDPAFTGPIYPGWTFNLAQQGQATAAVAPGAPGVPRAAGGAGTPGGGTGGTGGGTIPPFNCREGKLLGH